MASKTTLLDLPNELFPLIFQYLNSIDLLNAFTDRTRGRLHALIQSFISRVDISEQSIEWIGMYLPDLFANYNLMALRLQMKDLQYIVEYSIPTRISWIEIVKWNPDFQISEEVISLLHRNLKRLSFSVRELYEDDTLFPQLFRSDSQLEQLIINDCVLCVNNNPIDTCTRLTHLSVELDGMEPVFMFMRHLPSLHELKVKIRSEECFGQVAPDINGVKPCDTLRSVTFTGWIKYFDHLERFFAVFGSTIEYLFIHIDYRYHRINGEQLEHGLLDKMPRLSSLNLIIFSPMTDGDSISIKTFHSLTWQKFNTVSYWHDIHAEQHTIFTLPYKSDQFQCLSNGLVSTWSTNWPSSNCFDRVRTLSLIATTALTLKTFLFIKNFFPNITTVTLMHWMVHPLIEDENVEDRSVPSLDDELLSDTSLQICSVTKLCLSTWSQYDDYKTFRRFLRLFPNVVSLELYIDQPQLRDVLKHEYDDDFIENVFTHIKQVTITCENGIDIITNDEIRHVFPKAQHLIVQNDSLE